jgi:elongation factor P
MITVNELKPGLAFKYEGSIYVCIETSHNKTAMRQMIVKARSKNLDTGSIVDITFSGGGKVEDIFVDKAKMQYLYKDGDDLWFMDIENFEQIQIPLANLSWESNFIVEQSIVEVTSFEGRVLGVALPSKVVLTVDYTEPASKGDTVKTAMKDAILVTGLKVKVPMFVNIGDKIIVKTDTGEYDSRA